MLMTQQRAGLSLAVAHMLTQRKLIHCNCWTIFSFVYDKNRVQDIDAMLRILTYCRYSADNENHEYDAEADVLLIGFADVHNP